MTAPAWRRFAGPEWLFCLGAEKFADGSQPLCRDVSVDGLPGMAVLDGDALYVVLERDAGTDSHWLRHADDPGGVVARAVALLERETTSAALVALGLRSSEGVEPFYFEVDGLYRVSLNRCPLPPEKLVDLRALKVDEELVTPGGRVLRRVP